MNLRLGNYRTYSHSETANNKNNNQKEMIVKWDQMVIAANLDKNLAGPIADKVREKASCINLVRELLSENVDEKSEEMALIELSIEELFDANISDRVKVIYLDSVINEMRSSLHQAEANNAVHTACVTPNGDICIRGINRIRSLVLQGGGGKGIGYVEMLKVLTEKKQLDHLENVAGSSAGALAAAAVAVGIKPNELLNFTQNVINAQSTSASEVKTYFGTKDDVLFGINLDTSGAAAGIIQYIDEYIGNRVLQFLQNIVGDQASETAAFKNLNPREIQRLHSLYNSRAAHRSSNTAIGFDSMITFKDLETLSKIPTSSNPFLHLTITVYDNTRNTIVFCNAQNTPDMPISVAARGSMSLPIIFQPVIYKFPGTEKPSALRDGGICSNTPSEVFINEKNNPLIKKMQQQHTLTAIFDNNGNGQQSVSTTNEGKGFQYGTSLIDNVVSCIVGIFTDVGTSITENRQKENFKLNNVANIIIVGCGKSDTFNLRPSESELQEANLMSEAMTRNWVRQHANEFVSIDLCNIGDEFFSAIAKEGIEFRNEKNQNITSVILPKIIPLVTQCVLNPDANVAPIARILGPYVVNNIKNNMQVLEKIARQSINHIESCVTGQMLLYAQSLDKDELEAVINSKITGDADGIDYRIGLEWQKCCNSIHLGRYLV